MVIYRIAILADIHGNLPAFEAVMQDMRRHGRLDALLVAGDMIGGPGQQYIIDRLLDQGALMIQGNGEQRVVRMENGSSPVYYATTHQFAMPRWIYGHLNKQQRATLCALPEQRVLALSGAEPIRVVHGSPRKIDDLVLPDRACHPQLYYEPVQLEDIINLASEPVLVFGHTHLPWQVHINNRLALNPGAVNFPEDYYLGAQYALLEWDGIQWQPIFQRVRYDMQQLVNDYRQSGFLFCSPLARVILQSVLTGKDYLPVYFQHVRTIASRYTEIQHLLYFPDKIWDEAAKTFTWEIHI